MDLEQLVRQITNEVYERVCKEGSIADNKYYGVSSKSIAKMIDHSLLHPGLTDRELIEECEIAKQYHVASVCVKPYHVKMSKELLKWSDVMVCAVIGFPHGNNTIDIKVKETEQVLQDGADEVDMVVNIGKVLSEDWNYVEQEIGAIVEITRKHNVALKVIFENDLLPEDKYKIRLCQICSKLKVTFVKTSTGYNYVKESDGRYSYKGATEHDLKLMREYSSPEVEVKAAGSVGNLDAILKAKDIGVTRIGTKGTKKIIEDAKLRFGQ